MGFWRRMFVKTDAIIDKAKEWQSLPLDAIYPIIFMDATVLKIRVDRVVKNKLNI